MEKNRQTISEWHALLEEQKASGQSQSEFCLAKGLKLATFCYHKRKIAQESVIGRSVPTFKELPFPPAEEKSWNSGRGWSFSCKIFGLEVLALRLG